MASHRSGNDIVEICLPGGLPVARTDEQLVVGDNDPWIELKFLKQLPSSLREGLEKQSGGKFYQSARPPSPSGCWMRWEFWDPTQANRRRRGQFELGGGETGIPLIRVYVKPERIFSDEEHQSMVDNITRALDGATWETHPTISGVRVERTHGVESINQVISNTEAELRDACSIMQHPAVELAPARPGERELIGATQLAYTRELPENHLVGWWATHRLHALQEATEAIRSQLARQETERACIDAFLAKERAEEVDRSISEMRNILKDANALRPRLAFLRRLESPNLRLIGPAVTRDPRRRRLLDALRRTVEISTLKMDARLSRFRERTFDALFELWGAVELVRSLRALDWDLTDAPRVRWIDALSPERIVWSFRRDEARLEFIYEPHAERRQLSPQPATGPLLHRMQRVATTTDGTVEPRLIAVDPQASPDYALVLHTPRGTAFTIGDAIASDYVYAKRKSNWKSITSKIDKVAKDYARSLGWWSRDAVVLCSSPAIFVLVPGDEALWLAEQAVAKELDIQNVLLFAARPRTSQQGNPIDPARMSRVIETLCAHAIDGRHYLPTIPGL